jgi:photosystem II stability/assembly factor-like uncharacterized protein
VMYADALWESHDSGRNWTRLVRNHPETNEEFRDLSVSFQRMMIAMANGRLLIDGRSDAQQILPELDPPITEVMTVTANIREDKFFAIDSEGRTFATIEHGGIEWEQRESIPEGTTPQWRGLWRDGDIPGLLYMALGTGGVWKHIDGFSFPEGYYQMRAPGASNSPSSAIHRRVGIDGRLSDSPAPGRVFLLGTDGIASRMARNQWMRVNDPDLPAGANYRLIIAARGNPDRLYVLSNQGHIFRSFNGGQNWTTLSHGIPGMSVTGSWISPGNDEMTIYAGSGSSNEAAQGIYRTIDGGDNWQRVWSDGPGYQVRDFGHRTWFGGGTTVPTRWVHYTDDNWQSYVVAPFSGAVGGLGGRFAASPLAPGTVYHWRSTSTSFQRWRTGDDNPVNVKPASLGSDGHIRWAEATGQNTVIAIATTGASEESVVFRSPDQGDSWSPVINPGMIEGAFYERPLVAYHPDITNQWWAANGGTTERRVWSSTNDGLTWEAEICNVSGLGTVHQIMVAGGDTSE